MVEGRRERDNERCAGRRWESWQQVILNYFCLNYKLILPDPKLLQLSTVAYLVWKTTRLDSETIALALTGLATPSGDLYNQEKAPKPKSSARIYTGLFVRQWDSYVTENKSAIWYTTLKNNKSVSPWSTPWPDTLSNLSHQSLPLEEVETLTSAKMALSLLRKILSWILLLIPKPTFTIFRSRLSQSAKLPLLRLSRPETWKDIVMVPSSPRTPHPWPSRGWKAFNMRVISLDYSLCLISRIWRMFKSFMRLKTVKEVGIWDQRESPLARMHRSFTWLRKRTAVESCSNYLHHRDMQRSYQLL